MSYLIELQGYSDSPPEDAKEVFYGVGLVLDEIASTIKQISNNLEGTDCSPNDDEPCAV